MRDWKDDVAFNATATDEELLAFVRDMIEMDPYLEDASWHGRLHEVLRDYLVAGRPDGARRGRNQ